MGANHPIFDHLQRDAERHGVTYSRTQIDADALIAPPQVPTGTTGQTPPPQEPIAPRPGLVRRALRTLMISPNHNQPSGSTAPPAPPSPVNDRQFGRLVAAAQRLWLRREPGAHLRARAGQATQGQFVDALAATPGEPKLPDEIFPRLRWGGLFLYIAPNEKSVQNLAEAYDGKRGFVIEQPTTLIHASTLGLRLPGLSPRGYAFLARKTKLIQPGDFSERFTYHVELTPTPASKDAPDGYIVTKRVPTQEDILQRLQYKFPSVDYDDLRKRAHKLVDHVFPTFLTREAAMLGILQSNLQPAFRDKVPRPLGIEKDSRGFVRTLHMNWMRVGGKPLSQLDFAIQSAELLAAIHEQAGVMHLDLRMDNMVITPGGVGFVDFGSACKIGEQVNQSPMLGELFSEMMRTSQIQRMLGKMIERGHVTNNAISEVYGKVDKTVDSFYLALQINKPHDANPELRQLIEYDPESDSARALSSLTAAVLRPKNPEMGHYKSSRDIVRGLRRIERRVAPA